VYALSVHATNPSAAKSLQGGGTIQQTEQISTERNKPLQPESHTQ